MAVANNIRSAVPWKHRISIEDPLAIEKIQHTLVEHCLRHGAAGRPLVLLCIGTDRSTGDCLGPLVGTQLSCEDGKIFHVYGTLDHPVHAGNLEERLRDIKQKFADPFIIALDACLGSIENVGYINIGEGSLQPGAGVNKSLPPVGHIHITGVVNVGGFMEYLVLQNTRLSLVMKMANVMVKGLVCLARVCKQEKARSG